MKMGLVDRLRLAAKMSAYTNPIEDEAADEIERLQASIGTEKRMRKDSDDQAEELRAIVDKLPKTADGVPVVLGMNVWWPTDSPHIVREMGHPHGLVLDTDRSRTYYVPASDCFSTREAAEAAKDGSA